MPGINRRLATWAAFVKVEHTLFSLPVLFGGVLLAARGLPAAGRLGWILLAGVGARTTAMALNRVIDRRVDALNPRTAERELPAGRMRVVEAWGVVVAGLVLYLGACLKLPPICLWLSPLPLAVFVIYPFMKRFTPLAHFGVGAALGLAPLGGFVAVTGTLEGIAPAAWLAVFTWLWVAGFDIIYATLDEEFDRRQAIHSLPGWLGRTRALAISASLHLLAVVGLMVLYWRHLDGPVTLAGIVAVAAVLAAEQRLAHEVDLAFFRLNILVGFLVLGLVATGVAGI